MSNRLNCRAGRQSSLPPNAEAGGWTTLDYMLAAGLTWSLTAASPVLMALPLWVSSLMSPPG